MQRCKAQLQWLEILLLLLTLNWVMPVMRVQMLRRN
ncbi:Uncharacterised protein [Mycobacterium tuberculosis]|nr:Uncharacterised protein [Mycobacterium tuberculosis]